jgi:hypothetical protein
VALGAVCSSCSAALPFVRCLSRYRTLPESRSGYLTRNAVASHPVAFTITITICSPIDDGWPCSSWYSNRSPCGSATGRTTKSPGSGDGSSRHPMGGDRHSDGIPVRALVGAPASGEQSARPRVEVFSRSLESAFWGVPLRREAARPRNRGSVAVAWLVDVGLLSSSPTPSCSTRSATAWTGIGVYLEFPGLHLQPRAMAVCPQHDGLLVTASFVVAAVGAWSRCQHAARRDPPAG